VSKLLNLEAATGTTTTTATATKAATHTTAGTSAAAIATTGTAGNRGRRGRQARNRFLLLFAIGTTVTLVSNQTFSTAVLRRALENLLLASCRQFLTVRTFSLTQMMSI
jgi:hypothetical protein